MLLRFPAFFKAAYQFPLVRRLTHRFGPAVWRLPRALRRRIVHETQIRRLPGVSVWGYGSAEKVRPAVPWAAEAGGKAPTLGHRMASKPYRLNRPWVARLPVATLVGPHAGVVTAGGRVLLTAFRDQARILGLEPNTELLQLISRAGGQTQAEPSGPAFGGEVMSLVGRLDTNYGHWLTDFFAQLEGLEEYTRQTGRVPSVLIRKGGPPYIRQSIELLGLSSSRIIEWPVDSPPTRVEGLVVGSIPGIRVAYSPRSLFWLRDRLLEAAGVAINKVTPHRRLYIRRRPGGWRSVVNDEEVTRCLLSEGFETLSAESLSFAEQVRLFAEAGLIVGPHGSGLTNTLFAPGAAVLEMVGSYGDGSFYSIAASLGRPYRAMNCPPGGPDGQDLVVDTERLRREVRALQSRQPTRPEREFTGSGVQ